MTNRKDTSITLSGNVEVIVDQVRELGVERLQGAVVERSCGVIICGIVLGGIKAEANSCGRFEEENARLGVPGVGVWREGSVGVQLDGAVLEVRKESTWSTVQPEDHRVLRHIALTLEEPVMKLRGVCRGEVPGVVLEVEFKVKSRQAGHLVTLSQKGLCGNRASEAAKTGKSTAEASAKASTASTAHRHWNGNWN
ncbi:hypothetical protein TYRP_020566 [Tyrophagus putrescentiae]|nr:hypothetical protein TYRP_020566 [Tyrophagus putrescentiae]